MEPFKVPRDDVIAEMADDQLVGLIRMLEQGIADTTRVIKLKEGDGLDATAVRAARRHYSRGLRTAREIQKVRNGETILFEPARPVHTFISAFHALKAVNRLLGLCQAEHEATTALLADDGSDDDLTDKLWEAVERCHADVERALRDGGVAA